MSTRVVLFCACALIAVSAAPPRRTESAESRMAQDTSIVIKRIPTAYYYPLSLWPMMAFPVQDRNESYEEMYKIRRSRRVLVQENKR